MTVTAIVAQKGGCGKSTVCLNLAAVWAAKGRTVGLVDCDPQGNVSSGLTLVHRGEGTVTRLLTEALTDPQRTIRDEEWSTYRAGKHELFVLPAGVPVELEQVQTALLTRPGGDRALWRVLRQAREEFDHVLIDTPPSIGPLTMNAVAAADLTLTVVNPARWSAEGASRIQAYVLEAESFGVSQSKFGGAILNRVMKQSRVVANAVLEDFAATGIPMLDTHIPERVAVQEGEYLGEPAVVSAPKSDVAKAFAALAKEVHKMSPRRGT